MDDYVYGVMRENVSARALHSVNVTRIPGGVVPVVEADVLIVRMGVEYLPPKLIEE
jgi:hypothetical protein